jgi:methyltransferase family protein
MAGKGETDVRETFREWELDAESSEYLDVHWRRYAVLIVTVGRYEARMRALGGGPVRILDVGPGFQTELLRRRFPEALVDTLGFADTRLSPRSGVRHYPFDLNEAQEPARWPALPQHHVIVLAEVLEHLHTSPRLVLRFLKTALEPGGYLLIQTPNACALNRRVKMLLGRNPLQPIRENRTNPGHFHEYTVAELLDVARAAGFSVEELRVANYFEGGSWKHALFNRASRFLPARLREGITLVMRKK